MRNPKLKDYILLTVLALIWSSAFFNIKIATYSFGPVTIAFLRIFFWSYTRCCTLFIQKNKN
jgi:drug/metabolite transporter (DMT)-like permease